MQAIGTKTEFFIQLQRRLASQGKLLLAAPCRSAGLEHGLLCFPRGVMLTHLGKQRSVTPWPEDLSSCRPVGDASDVPGPAWLLGPFQVGIGR